MRTCRLVTLGCKVNQYETQLVKEALLRAGFREAAEAEPADLCVVNTCTVTENADSRGRQVVRQLARENPNCQTIVTGCYATHDPAAIAKLPNVIEVVPDKRELPDVLLRLGVAEFPTGISRFDGHKRAFVKVQDGCLLRCSYCIIPMVRPGLSSRSPDDIEAEVRRLIEFGYEEIVLTGIHVGHYGVDTTRGRSGLPPFRLWHLLQRLDQIPGRWRLRLSSIEAAEFSDDFISAAADCEHLCPHFHPALQSGSDTVLARMRRRYRVAQFLETVAKLHERLPNPALSTDVIVGFPGETDEEFEQTLDTCRQARFMKIHIFPFSRRRGTPAAKMPNQVSAPIKKQRCQELARLETEMTRQFASTLIDRPVEVLVEGLSSSRSGFVQGTDRRYANVELPGNSRDFGHLVSGMASRMDSDELVAIRFSAPNQASVFAVDCLESSTSQRATTNCAIHESPA
ncbi:MAG: tRNA (N(6)-L-threonylcarbamoyladenosine(37)-C(2))-methylthiotransferase MtaB [Planctomycetes bacterium]|nr:tRNA (N(6)-L-threonylcarbamoyladenosine(37)-C(2))-methylthiotransferase MtaB [Planctomycetota bacterium]